MWTPTDGRALWTPTSGHDVRRWLAGRTLTQLAADLRAIGLRGEVEPLPDPLTPALIERLQLLNRWRLAHGRWPTDPPNPTPDLATEAMATADRA